MLAAATEAELSLDRGSTLRLEGPARLRLGGTARAVEVRLDAGTLDAAVAHRVAGETFAVATPDLRVEVRGTKFAVVATPVGSSVRVSEGRVAVRFADGSERPVAAGESASWPMPAAPPPGCALPIPGSAAAEARPSCGAVVRACEEAGRAARRSMRSGDAARALRLIAAGSHDARDPDATCASSLTACEDELRYLRAEAFRQEGELDEAVAAYHQLDRHGAPAAMRQNALYAAAQIEAAAGAQGAGAQRLRKGAGRGARRGPARGGAGRFDGERRGAGRHGAGAAAGATLSGDVPQRPAGRDGAATGGHRRAALTPAAEGPDRCAARGRGVGPRLPA